MFLFISPDDIDDKLLNQWNDLYRRSSVKNIFYHSDFLMPALRHLMPNITIKIALIYDDKTNILIGFYPVMFDNHYKIFKCRAINAVSHPYCYAHEPLIDTDYTEYVIKILLQELPYYGDMLRMANIQTQSKIYDDLNKIPTPYNDFNSYARACLQTDLSADTYWEYALPKKKRKEINRLSSRLSDTGHIHFEKSPLSNDYAEKFLELESMGYKGMGGTAIKSNPHHQAFFMDIINGHSDDIIPCIYVLKSGDIWVSALIGFQTGRYFFAFKTAYHPDFSDYSPGVLLFKQVTYSLLNDTPNVIADSCAAPNHPMINSLWRARIEMTTPEIALNKRFGIIIRGIKSIKFVRNLFNTRRL